MKEAQAADWPRNRFNMRVKVWIAHRWRTSRRRQLRWQSCRRHLFQWGGVGFGGVVTPPSPLLPKPPTRKNEKNSKKNNFCEKKRKTLKFPSKKKQEIETIENTQKKQMSNMIKNEERGGPNPEKVEARRASARREGGPKGGARRNWGPKGRAPQRGGWKGGGPKAGGQKFRAFFPLSRPHFRSFSLSLGVFSWKFGGV